MFDYPDFHFSHLLDSLPLVVINKFYKKRPVPNQRHADTSDTPPPPLSLLKSEDNEFKKVAQCSETNEKKHFAILSFLRCSLTYLESYEKMSYFFCQKRYVMFALCDF